MNFSRRHFLGSSLALSAANLAKASQLSEQTSTTKRFARSRGKNILATDGSTARLRGINLGNWLVNEGYMFLFQKGPQSSREIEAFVNQLVGPSAAANFWLEYRRRYITEKDIQFIRSCGLNSVRVPLHYKFFLSGGEGFDLLDPLVDWCRRAQLWVVLDMHCAPGGQTGSNIDDSWNYPHLYDSEADQQLLCETWRSIAQHHRDESTILGYDLLNEPIPHWPRLRIYNESLEPLYRRIVKAIREVDSNHCVILEAAQWDSNFKVFGQPFDNNTIYEFHKYWMPPEAKAIQEYLDFSERYQVPIWLGESGENTDLWIRQFTELLDHAGIGWCFWTYKKIASTSCMVSVPKPAYWDEIVAFARLSQDTGNAEKLVAARPSGDHCREALRSLLDNMQWESCHINPGYLEALGLQKAAKLG